MASIWVAELRISEPTAVKIAARHGLTVDEIRDAVVCVPGLPFRWDDHPERGLRAVVSAQIREHEVTVVLYAAGQDVWWLGSAYRLH